MLKQTPKSAGPAPRGSVALEADMAQPVEPVSTADVTEQFDWEEDDGQLQTLMWERAHEGCATTVTYGGTDAYGGTYEEGEEEEEAADVHAECEEEEEEVEVNAEQAAGNAYDPNSWVVEEQLEPGSSEDDVWSNWSGWTQQDWDNWRANKTKYVVKQEHDTNTAVHAHNVNRDTYAPWGIKAHDKNNELRDGKRGWYTTDDQGNAIFQANDEYGGGAWDAGAGRARGRTRGQGSQAKQTQKYTRKCKGTGKSKGKGTDKYWNSSARRADDRTDLAMSQMSEAIKTMSTMALSTEKLVGMVASSSVKDEPHDASSASSSSWGWRHKIEQPETKKHRSR